MASSQVILVDDLPSYRRVALIRDGQLDQIWFDDAEQSPYRTGAVVAVRLAQIFADHNRITVMLDDIPASLRLGDGHHHRPGDMIAASVTGPARDDGYSRKPLQLKEANHIAGKMLPSDTGLITPAPDALARATAAAPEAVIHHDDDGTLWHEYGVDLQLEQAAHPDMDMPEGGRVILSTPPGAAVIDGDSAASRLSPLDLAKAMVPLVMRQLRLRRIGGPIVIDFPRLDDDGMKTIHTLMRSEAKKDPFKPSLHGFTRGGLYTMARPWRDGLLADERLPRDRTLGLAVLRFIRAHHKKMTPGALNLRLPQEGIDWLNGAGADLLQQLVSSISFQVHFFPDNLIDDVVHDN